MAGNRIKIGGTWHHIDDLSSRSRIISLDGTVRYEFEFGTTVLELSQGETLRMGIQP
jgi:hypothetical protein